MKPTYLIIHHSYSLWGDARVIDSWHKERGFKRKDKKTGKTYHIGYHKVILNGYPTYSSWAKKQYDPKLDGKIQQGRPDYLPGAHCIGKNANSLGLCLIGNFDSNQPTDRQRLVLVDALARLCIRHEIEVKHIFFHNSFSQKTCPGKWFIGTFQPMSLMKLRKMVNRKIEELDN